MAPRVCDWHAALGVLLEAVVRVDQHLQLPEVRLRELRPQGFQVSFNLRDVSRGGAFRVAGASLAPVEIRLVTWVGNDGVK